jgi:predicted phage terminase large subunit-like protein
MTDDLAPLRPQPGPQEAFLSTPADIAIYGGAAFGGKSFALLLESIRHTENPKFGAVIFRRTTKMIRAEGGLWDTAEEIFPRLEAVSNLSNLAWTFPSGAKVTFAHLEHEKNKLDWQGAQVAMIGFDELTHFTASQFWYLLSRNRSGSGVAGYIRATTNPDPDSWVAELIAWWIDPETGYAIPERSGVVRWFVRYRNELIWADSPEELKEQFPNLDPKSLTFIASSFRDNKIGMEKDPAYMASLDALPEVDRERLKFGNWKIKPAAGDFFKEEWFEIVERIPDHMPLVWVRYWDRAATAPSTSNPDPDYTAGILVGKDRAKGIYYVADLVHERKDAGEVLHLVKGTAQVDGVGKPIALEHDPAQAGKAEMAMYTRELAGFDVRPIPKTQSKEAVWRVASAQARGGNIKVLRAPWNKPFFNELVNLPKGKHDDIADSLGGAVGFLELDNTQPPAGETVGTPEEIRQAMQPQGLGKHPMRRMAGMIAAHIRGRG